VCKSTESPAILNPKVTASDAKVVLPRRLDVDNTLVIDEFRETPRNSRSTFCRSVRL